MGGRIELDSTPGVGATFRVSVTLPRADGAQTPAFARARSCRHGRADRRAALDRIRAGRAAPDALGRQRPCAPTPSAAAATARRAALGRRAGRSCARRGRSPPRSCERPATPIARRIVLITPTERHGLDALKDAGFTGYLVKPVRAASLAARLASNDAFETHGACGSRATRRSRAAPAAAASRSWSPRTTTSTRCSRARCCPSSAIVRRSPQAARRRSTPGSAARSAGAPYDLILMDVHMPGMDGLEAARRIRAAEDADRAQPRTPIVALTANAFAEDRDACLDAGMDGFAGETARSRSDDRDLWKQLQSRSLRLRP